MTDIVKKEVTIPVAPEKKSLKEREQDARKFLKESASAACDPQALLLAIDKGLERYKTDKDKKAAEKQLMEKINEALPVIALDTHYILARGVMEEIRPFVIEFANQLTAEYDCKTPTEKALAEVVTAAYARILQFTGVMTRQVRDEHCSDILSNFYKVASQELDRANRHFTSALATLKQLKSPAMTVQVKATNAFVAQNQQVNATAPDPSEGNKKKVYENIESK
ncbi:TPA: hypothetical protein DDZ01_03470 [Candidatus Uhrbacteria bacterium]|nr:MAG: hypothetical protein UT94_C0002G0031 [Candidatus Uhrbacteria bacterium GW2011_GWF2_40_263]OGL97385.1 MAG: hypothetical protein A2332_04670 [Candidatus Uhrbacteria bacterium RIFOXYB2_FULL_41_18]HBK35026.1 hypothetical protein [Candidatus Uhrbacteria bacterium]HCB56179.1 hypothetical protein [Candidatus Uhrbacteria bacterium]